MVRDRRRRAGADASPCSSKWVNQNSGSLNFDGRRRRSARCCAPSSSRSASRSSGSTCSAAGRAGHIVATPQGQRPRQAAAADRPPRHGVRARLARSSAGTRSGNDGDGPGAGDDKGGMAVMVAALRAMQAAGTLKNADIEVVLTGDEEDSGSPIEIARRDLIAAGKRADVALDFEGLAQEDGLRHGLDRAAQLGRLDADRHRPQRPFERHLHARRRATARSTSWRGSSTRFRRELPEDKLTFNVGLIGGGATAELDAGRIRIAATGKTNIIAGDRDRPRRPARASARSRSSAPRRRCRRSSPSRCPAQRRRSNSTPTAIRRWRRPKATARCSAGSTRSTATWACAEMGELDPVKRGAGDISFVAADVDGLVGLGPASRRRPCAGRDGRYRLDLPPGQARRDPDEPAGERAALGPATSSHVAVPADFASSASWPWGWACPRVRR